MNRGRRDLLVRMLFFLALAAAYGAVFSVLRDAPFFDVSQAHNDRLFSADDVYCAQSFYSAEMDQSARIIKHPLFIVLASLLTQLEELVLGPVSMEAHYGHIVLLQMVLCLVTVVYLERILRLQYQLGQRQALLLCGVYALAFSTVFFTFVAETYVVSALVLVMTFYYVRQGNGPATVALGVLAAGVTVTNAVLWAAIVWLGEPGSWKRRLVLLMLGGACFCGVIALLPVGAFFFERVIPGGVGSALSFRDQFPIQEVLVRSFFIFFGSTSFYLHTTEESPFGGYEGEALSFLPSADGPVIAAGVVWLLLLAASAVWARRDQRVRAPLGVLGINLLLHGAVQYGLKEGFLYSLHHWPAQVLIAALALRPGTARWRSRVCEGIVWGYLLCEGVLNLPGYRELVEFITR